METQPQMNCKRWRRWELEECSRQLWSVTSSTSFSSEILKTLAYLIFMMGTFLSHRQTRADLNDGNFFLPDLEQKNSWRQIHTKFYGCKLRTLQRAAIVKNQWLILARHPYYGQTLREVRKSYVFSYDMIRYEPQLSMYVDSRSGCDKSK